nr:ABC transporter ATP-binding protein [uncultured Desulfuromonas sp.]
MQPAIDIDQLSKQYRTKKMKTVTALSGLTLQVAPGEVFGFLGPNGAGKSTTIKSLMALLRPTAGVAKIFGHPVESIKARKNIGYLPENPSFYSFLTAREYLHLVGGSFGMTTSECRSETARVLNLLDLEKAASRPIRSYSKGMVQRLGLAQALLHNPDLYILDEPMSGLDPLGRALVKEIILDLKMQGKTVFFSTHVTADVERVCDRVGIIAGGVLQVVKNVQDVMDEGILGYRVKFSGCATGEEFEVGNGEESLSKEDLVSFLVRVEAAQGHIDLIEPCRKDLEAFFLDTIKGRLS